MSEFKEDRLFNERVIELVKRVHGFQLVSVERHKQLNGLEVDVYTKWRTTNNRVTRSMLFELKDWGGWDKLVDQAYARLSLADYVYVVYGDEPANILSHPTPARRFCKLIQDGVGVIAYHNGEPLFLAKAKYRKPGGIYPYLYRQVNKP